MNHSNFKFQIYMYIASIILNRCYGHWSYLCLFTVLKVNEMYTIFRTSNPSWLATEIDENNNVSYRKKNIIL